MVQSQESNPLSSFFSLFGFESIHACLFHVISFYILFCLYNLFVSSNSFCTSTVSCSTRYVTRLFYSTFSKINSREEIFEQLTFWEKNRGEGISCSRNIPRRYKKKSKTRETLANRKCCQQPLSPPGNTVTWRFWRRDLTRWIWKAQKTECN